MTRAEKASDATLDEILASIRRIIAEEPEGARPLPVTKPKSPVPGPSAIRPAAAAPAVAAKAPAAKAPAGGADPSGGGLSSLRASGAAAPAPTLPMAPMPAAPAAKATGSLGAAAKELADPPLPGASRREPATDERQPASRSTLDAAFGRLADALGGNRRICEPPVDDAPLADAEPAAETAVDDLSDLLADSVPTEIVAPKSDLPTLSLDPVAMPVEPAPAASAAPQGGARSFSRRTIDLGSIVPSRDQAAQDLPEIEVEAPPSPSLAPAPSSVRPSAQARAVDKMLSARIAAAKPAAPVDLEPSEPIVIAAMPDPAPVLGTSAGETVADPDAEAASALDMLAAGLAHAAPARAAEPAMREPAPADDVPADAVSEIEDEAEAEADDEAVAPTAEVAAGEAPAAEPVNSEPADEEAAAPKPAPESSARPVVSTAAPALPPAPPPAPVRAAEVNVSAAASAAPAAPQAAPAPLAAVPSLPAMSASSAPATLPPVVGVRTIEDMVAELLRPMLREWLAENMPRMVEKALRIELAEGLKTVNHVPRKVADN